VIPGDPDGIASYGQPSILAEGDFRRWLNAAVNPLAGRHGMIVTTKGFEEFVLSRLDTLEAALGRFRELVGDANTEEEVIHQYIVNHPLLLDVYSEHHSKPRFTYPEGRKPADKDYVAPGFILKQADGRYVVIEIEKPSKELTTNSGRPTARITQEAFQIVEFYEYIQDYHQELQDVFPDIQKDHEFWLIVGRMNEPAKANELARIKATYIGRMITYNDVLDRAERMLVNLKAPVKRD
jgi:hypothetical protein